MEKFDKVDENPFTCDGPLNDAPQQMSDRELLIRLEEKVKYLSQMVYSEFKNLQDFMKAQKELITKVEEEVEKDLKAVQRQHRADCEYIHNEIAIAHTDTIDDGWLLCDGSAVSRTTYADLFAKIGTTWGTGDGSTTFNLPNGQGNTLVGIGASGGEQEVTLTVTELPSHAHSGGITSGGLATGAYNDILVPAAEMQDKEDYANATGDWELIGYTVDWAENI
jgi:microcystin-dependent protein